MLNKNSNYKLISQIVENITKHLAIILFIIKSLEITKCFEQIMRYGNRGPNDLKSKLKVKLEILGNNQKYIYQTVINKCHFISFIS